MPYTHLNQAERYQICALLRAVILPPPKPPWEIAGLAIRIENQGGQGAYFDYFFLPYYESLSADEQPNYLKNYCAPREWIDHFEWLRSVEDE